jgi:hypothetical protein
MRLTASSRGGVTLQKRACNAEQDSRFGNFHIEGTCPARHFTLVDLAWSLRCTAFHRLADTPEPPLKRIKLDLKEAKALLEELAA